MKSKVTNMSGKLSFTTDGAGEHLGPTYFWDFTLMPSAKLMLLLISCMGMLTCLTFCLTPPPVKKYFVSPD